MIVKGSGAYYTESSKELRAGDPSRRRRAVLDLQIIRPLKTSSGSQETQPFEGWVDG
ncbi:MAG: hypothetical protein LBF65_00575 [Holosporales bacterium]|nr:hypothetical protein [Holosporales bacterium]